MRGVRIWIDDTREPPEGYDYWLKWFSDFQRWLRHSADGTKISRVSFDYVLLDDPMWPRPHEKSGDACVELLASYPQFHADDLEVEFHSTDEQFNDRMRAIWESSRSWR